MWSGIRWSAAALLALALWPAIAATQVAPATDAALPAAGTTIESLVPAGWTIEQRQRADFNRDGRADALLLLRQAAAQGATPPRILLVALAKSKSPGYVRAAANAQLIPRNQPATLEDPMADGEITVRRGGFEVKIGMMSGAGSYLAATMRFRFRLEGTCVRLIGYDRAEMHRGTLDTRDVSVNFLTGDVVRSTGNAQSDKTRSDKTLSNKTAAQRSRLAANPRRCLPDIPNGWTFDPTAPAPAR